MFFKNICTKNASSFRFLLRENKGKEVFLVQRRVVGMVAALLLMLSITANAVQMRILSPRVTLSFSGTTANCSAIVTDAGKELVITLELWHGDDLVDSWPASGNGKVAVQGSCRVVKGETYTLIVTGTADGSPFSSTPFSRTC